MSDTSRVVEADPTPVPLPSEVADPMSEPTFEETHAEFMRFYAANRRGEIDPEQEHYREFVAFYDGRAVGYGTDSYTLQHETAARLGVHWARVIIMYPWFEYPD